MFRVESFYGGAAVILVMPGVWISHPYDISYVLLGQPPDTGRVLVSQYSLGGLLLLDCWKQLTKDKRTKNKTTTRQKEKSQRPNREFSIVTSGQFRTLAVFFLRACCA